MWLGDGDDAASLGPSNLNEVNFLKRSGVQEMTLSSLAGDIWRPGGPESFSLAGSGDIRKDPLCTSAVPVMTMY